MSLSMRERLEKLKQAPTPKKEDFFAERFFPKEELKKEEPKEPSIDTKYQNRLEKYMVAIEKLKQKMLGGSFLSFYNDLKQAEKDFLRASKEAREKKIIFSEPFRKKIEELEKKIRR